MDIAVPSLAMPDDPNFTGECCRPLFALRLILPVSRGRECPHNCPHYTGIAAAQPVRSDGRKKTAQVGTREANEAVWTEERFQKSGRTFAALVG